MNDPANPSSRPWRRFLRFSVRGMIVLVLVIGTGLGWLVRSARIQREAVAVIETDGGGGVAYDWDSGAGTTDFRGRPPAPNWLADLVGVDYFGRVRFVVLWDARPATIAAVSRLSGLRRLAINGSGLRDTDLAPLETLTELSELVLSGDAATDAGLKHVNGLTKLRKLVLVNSDVTGLWAWPNSSR